MGESNLFTAKVRLPELRGNTLRRERLVSQLTALKPGQTGLVQAPAGYGKTTLVADVTRDSDSHIVWLTLDEFDRDVQRLLDYLAFAVTKQTIVVGTSEARSPYDLLAYICAEVAKFPGRTWIVLDDLHSLDGAEEALSLVDYLALRLPENACLLITTRTKPRLLSLARLRAQELVVEVTARDLAFTHEEILEWYRTVRRRVIASDEIANILTVTDGWPVAVTTLETNSSSSSTSLDQYISSELLARLSPDLRKFLGEVLVLETLEPQACDFVLSRDDSAALLARLEHENVPIVRLDDGASYQLHALVRDRLRADLRLRQPALSRELECRAGEWYQRSGVADLAVEHFARAEEWDRCRQLVSEEAPRAYRDGRWHAITTWLALIPEQVRMSSPELPVWEARILVRFGRADEALRVIENMERSLGVIIPSLRSELQALRSASLRVKGDLDAAIAAGRASVDLAIESDASLTAVAEARKQLGMALFTKGSFGGAETELRAAVEIFERRGDAEESAICNGCLGSSLASLGQPAEAIVYLERATSHWRRIGNAKELSWTLNNLAATYVQSGQLMAAKPCLAEAVRTARAAGYTRAEAYAFATLADVDRLSGDLTAAREEYQTALSLSGHLGEATLRTYGLVGLSDVARQLGQIAEADALASEALANAHGRGSAYEEGLARLALARLHRHRGELRAGLNDAAAAVEALSESDPSHEYVESVLLLGDLQLQTRRRREDLIHVLTEFAERVGNHGIENLVSRIGADFRRVLEFAASKKIAGHFYHDILRRISGGGEVPEWRASASGSAFPSVEVRTLGTCDVVVDGRSILDHEWESAKSRELFVFLVSCDRPQYRDEIIANLWPDVPRGKANSLFHSSLYRVRRATYHEVIVQSSGKYCLNAAAIFRWDVHAFKDLLQSARSVRGETESIARLRSSVDIYQGPFLTMCESEWADALRSELELEFVDAASRLVDALMLAGRPLEAVTVCERLVGQDPYSEAACSRMLKLSLQCRTPEVGVKTYERYQATLRDELNAAPSDELLTLYKKLRTMLVSS
jgi:LuxR family maltose regulon positive regulatory protein